jgi:hypothetical protein
VSRWRRQVESVQYSELLILVKKDFRRLCQLHTDFLVSAWAQSPMMRAKPRRWDLVRTLVRMYATMRWNGSTCTFAEMLQLRQELFPGDSGDDPKQTEEGHFSHSLRRLSIKGKELSRSLSHFASPRHSLLMRRSVTAENDELYDLGVDDD